MSSVQTQPEWTYQWRMLTITWTKRCNVLGLYTWTQRFLYFVWMLSDRQIKHQTFTLWPQEACGKIQFCCMPIILHEISPRYYTNCSYVLPAILITQAVRTFFLLYLLHKLFFLLYLLHKLFVRSSCYYTSCLYVLPAILITQAVRKFFLLYLLHKLFVRSSCYWSYQL